MRVKIYGGDPEGEKRYSPAQCIGCEVHEFSGRPDPKHISTSYIERRNPGVRMTNRRFTRLTTAFSKKTENHMARCCARVLRIQLHHQDPPHVARYPSDGRRRHG